MHPDVCRFISEQIYEGRLGSHPSCARQSTEFGTGLRWLPADHVGAPPSRARRPSWSWPRSGGCSARSWVDQHGAPRSARRRGLHGGRSLQRPGRTCCGTASTQIAGPGVSSVGTVDKFQGREAPVVFFTMTTSSADDMPRGAEFLFSRNRLNVAISRARCLAYLVCTEELLEQPGPRCIEEMRLISTLCSFVEYCTR